MKPLLTGLMVSALIAAAALPGCGSPGLQPARDYTVIEPAQPVAGPGAIEVIGFFWFGCPHCADMHPQLQAWRQQLPADVAFVPRPAVFKPGWEPAARLHLALSLLGELDRTTGALFEAVQGDQIDLAQEDQVLDWGVAQGIARERLAAALRAPEVQAQLQESRAWPQAYQLRGVPAFVVQGRYLTSNGHTGSAQKTLAVVDGLVQRTRAQRAQPH